MSINFSNSDLISRMNVALYRNLENVMVPNITRNLLLLELMYKNGFIRGFNVVENGKRIKVLLKFQTGLPLPRSMKLISTPGKRVFWKLHKLSLNYNVSSFAGSFILSTSKGLITSADSLLCLHLGGEVMLQLKT